jgi:hypothetical protein
MPFKQVAKKAILGEHGDVATWNLDPEILSIYPLTTQHKANKDEINNVQKTSI